MATTPATAGAIDLSALPADFPRTLTGDTLFGGEPPAWEGALDAWLTQVGVDTSGWGQSGAKRVSNLVDELRAKESTLQLLHPGKAFRCLSVVKLVLRQPGLTSKHLACYSQRMADGRVRSRNVLPSEKLIAGEVPTHAALRGVKEEMGGLVTDLSAVDLLLDTHLSWDEIIESPSFPSLTTMYTLHQSTHAAPLTTD